MSRIKLQQGASSVGFLTASAIFAGLLAYANYYGFEDSPFSSQEVAEQVEPSSDSTKIASKDSVIQPQSGIFTTPTLTDVKAELPPQQTASSALENTAPEVTAQPAVNSETPMTEAPQGDNSSPERYSAYALPAATSSAVAYPQDYAAANFDFMQQRRLDAYQQLAHDGRGYGRGKGRGNADGEGEFNFSMSFKSRARMAADSDIESDFDASTNQYYLGDGYANSGFYPAYGYSQYRY